jgi:hypothetical protein
MAFPGPGAQIYKNDAGEVTGWDYPSDEPYEMGPEEEERLEQEHRGKFYRDHGFDIDDACVHCLQREAAEQHGEYNEWLCGECIDFVTAKDELLQLAREDAK